MSTEPHHDYAPEWTGPRLSCGFLAAWCWAIWQIGNELLNSRTAAQKEEPYDH